MKITLLVDDYLLNRKEIEEQILCEFGKVDKIILALDYIEWNTA